MSVTTKPELFIIESLTLEDEDYRRFEGDIIRDIIDASGKRCEYYYLRTKQELQEILKSFRDSNDRYLHLSCHGTEHTMQTTFDTINLDEAGIMFGPYLHDRRLFVSACSMTTNALFAQGVMTQGCMSILGPCDPIDFKDARVLWASLYHVLFAADANRIKRTTLRAKAQEVANMYQVRLRLFREASGGLGFAGENIEPHPEPHVDASEVTSD